MAAENVKPDYALGGDPVLDEFMRRRNADVEAAFLLRHLRAGSSLVDAGCGQGTITAGFAAVLSPGEVVGFDQQESHLQHGRKLAAERGLTNLSFESGDIYDPPLSGQRFFDAAYANAVLSHLRDPIAALQALKKLLKPRGLVGIRDRGGEFLATGAESNAPTRILSILEDTIDATSQNPYGSKLLGPNLARLASEVGLEVLELDAVWDIRPAKFAVSVLSGIISGPVRLRAIDLGLTTDEEASAILAATQRWAEDPGAMFFCPWFTIVARTV